MTARQATSKTKVKSIDFDASLKKLEEIVKKLEEEELPLETSLKLFAEGQKLAHACEEQLRAAENKIRVLMENEQGEIEEREALVENDDDSDNVDA